MMEDRANILREMKVCRFCLSNEERELSNIYDRHPSDSKQSVPIPLQIMACVSIEVFSNDGMPQLICSSCRKLTAQAYLFKSNCKKGRRCAQSLSGYRTVDQTLPAKDR
ncbi:hypothetical protein NQ317_004537 [Molorchus minor]|uniref:ZAD domain-containing protein n=1 Tax=Molorchus minor TaxID=1323400 RepID=A0ABQ9JKS0_9CUCU|nr:hypothetical protein NQ317_004537 [Molorchus minor]